MKVKWIFVVIFVIFMSSGAVYGQEDLGESESSSESERSVEEEESVDGEDSGGVQSLFENLEESGGEDYEEMTGIRVLERAVMPTVKEKSESVDLGFGFSSRDPMGLSGESALELLVRGSSASSPMGLQRQSLASFKEALQMVSAELEPYVEGGKSTGVLKQPFGLDVLHEKSVKEYLALFSAQGSKTLKSWLKRGGQWRWLIESILVEEGVPKELFYLAMIESGFKLRVKSPSNAGGMWQFIPATAVEQGLKIDEYVDERFDPEKSTRAAVKYLKKQYGRYHSWPLAMAAYNGGPGTVNVAIDRYNSNDYFKLVSYGAMYDETRRYVPKIVAAALIGENSKFFGFEGLVIDEALRYDEVEVGGGVSLKTLAEAASCSVDELKSLNAELLKDQTPSNVSRYRLKIPHGRLGVFVERYDSLAKRYGKDYDRVRLRVGELVEHVSERYRVAPRVLYAVNGLSSRERAAYGSELLVPKAGRGEYQGVEAGEKKVALVSSEDFRFGDKERYFYEVNQGDNLEEIAQAVQVDKFLLARWNDLDVRAKLRKGMILQIFLRSDSDQSGILLGKEKDYQVFVIGSAAYIAWQESNLKQSDSKGSKRGSKIKGYTVKKGDTLSKIAKRHKVSTANLAKWNNLKSNAKLRAGMRLVIK